MDQDNIVHRLWDDLSDFEAVKSETACHYLMEALARLVNAKNVGWIGAMRTIDADGDPLFGWRIGAVAYWREEAVNAAAIAELKALWAKREVDELNLMSVRGAGETFRAFSLRQSISAAWFETPRYRLLFRERGVHDTIYVHFPVNADAESVFSLHGGAERGAFTSEEIALAASILRGIKWFHRRLLLSHGLTIASSPLSPAERRVLAELLTEASEKEIARRLELAPSTVHQYAASIYRKFAVKGRTGLLSLWLNQAG